MKTGSKIKMNKLSNYSGEVGTIIKASESQESFIIQLDSGLVIAAPAEVLDFNI